MLRPILVASLLVLVSRTPAQTVLLLGSDPDPMKAPFSQGYIREVYMPSGAYPNGTANHPGNPFNGVPGTPLPAFSSLGLSFAFLGTGGIACDWQSVPPRLFCTDGFVMSIEDHPEYGNVRGVCSLPAGPTAGFSLGTALTAAGSGLVPPIMGIAWSGNTVLPTGSVPRLLMIDSAGTIESFTVSPVAPFLTFLASIPSPFASGIDPFLEFPSDLSIRADQIFVSTYAGPTSRVVQFTEGSTSFTSLFLPSGVFAVAMAINRSSDPLSGIPGPYHIVTTDGFTVHDALSGASFPTGNPGALGPYGACFSPDAQYTSSDCGSGFRPLVGLASPPHTTLVGNAAVILIPQNSGAPMPGTLVGALFNTFTSPPVVANAAGNACTHLFHPTTTLFEFTAPSGPCLTIPGAVLPLLQSTTVQFVWFAPIINDYIWTDAITGANVFF